MATMCGVAQAASSLWYTSPVPTPYLCLPWDSDAKANQSGGNGVWERQTLPIGNGRIGGTGYGGAALDCVTLNEVSLWSGGPNSENNGSGYAYGPKADKNAFGSYQPFGNLVVSFDGVDRPTDYKRSLNLDEGILRTEFTAGDTKHTRECFVSHPDDVLVYHAAADKGKELSAKVALLPFHDVHYSRSGDTICMQGTLSNGEKFEGRVQVRVQGGSCSVVGDSAHLTVDYVGKGDGTMPSYQSKGVPYIHISGAQSFTVVVALATDYKMDAAANWKGTAPAKRNEKTLQAIRKKSYNALRRAHMLDHGELYGRMSIDLGKSTPEQNALPTNERLKRYREVDPHDPELEALVYQYGRYVLVAGSRPGNWPVNLQGIWNNKVHAPWACDYHNNINLQMCYWGAEVANLSECHLPLIQFISAMQEPLHEMTKKEFGNNIRGWTTRISQNPWGGGGWTKWNLPVNAWYALHVWDHFLFTGDMDYLKKTAYPILKNVSQFWEDHLKEIGEHGEGLMSGGKPIAVAEHPELADIKKGSLVAPKGWSHEWGPVEDGCMHDQQLIWELFDITAVAAGILKTDSAYAKELKSKRDRLVGNRIGSGGYLQEWIVDRPNMVSGHRHTSHLIGVFPGSTISSTRTPDLANAAMKSLELRGLSADNRRSWTWPWRTALWARFHEAERAHEMVQYYLTYNALDNLFGNHPPMQLDGTYGMTGGISEMLLQSHAGELELLPALPAAWKDGSARGLRARGGLTIDMKWQNGKVSDLKIYSSSANPKPINVVYNGDVQLITPEPAASNKDKTATE